LAWVAGYIPRWFAHLKTVNYPLLGLIWRNFVDEPNAITTTPNCQIVTSIQLKSNRAKHLDNQITHHSTHLAEIIHSLVLDM